MKWFRIQIQSNRYKRSIERVIYQVNGCYKYGRQAKRSGNVGRRTQAIHHRAYGGVLYLARRSSSIVQRIFLRKIHIDRTVQLAPWMAIEIRLLVGQRAEL